MDDEAKKAVIDEAERDFLHDVLKYCHDCDGDGCYSCNKTGYEMARRARKYGLLSYSMGYKLEDLYKAFLAQHQDNPDYKEAVDAITGALASLRDQPCPSCNGEGTVERYLSPVLGGGFEERECPGCKGSCKMESTSTASADMRRAPIKAKNKEKHEVLAFYEEIRNAKKKAGGPEDPPAS